MDRQKKARNSQNTGISSNSSNGANESNKGNDSEGRVIIDITLDRKDYRHFVFHHSKRSFIFGAVLYYVIFVAAVLYFSNQDGFDPEVFRYSLFVALPAGIAVSGVTTLLIMGFAALRVIRVFKTDKLIVKPTEYAFSDSGVETSSETGSGIVKWEEIYKVREARHIIIIYIAKNKALLIPKRYMSSENQMDRIRKIIAKNLPAGKLGRKLKAFA